MKKKSRATSKKQIPKTKKKQKRIIAIESDFEVKPSSIKGIGMGLFTKIDLRKGDTVGYYTGKVLTDDQANSDKYVESRYLLWICKDHWIFGEGKGANYTRFINHSTKPNAHLVTSVRWKTARFEVLKPIKAGEEVFFNYGDDYWNNMDFAPKEK